ncbi:class I SAM-dependent methyltransferase [Stackebrandtia soli]|uniref:class I SAM-dependent methyltransferase n=1 Tax=Stackebrandtia soli TaxID=1892856 RepID=UPI0039E81B1F
MTRKTSAVRFMTKWDRRAAGYDARTAGVERRLLADGRKWVCERARGVTLELAVGTGLNLPHYAEDVELTGIEWSPQMVEVARERARSLGRRIDLHVADAARLPFASASFDTVLSTFAMCCIPDERGALAEAARVLRPGGRLLLADHVVSTSWPLRFLQHAADLITVPTQGEHFARRPIRHLAEVGLTVVESKRTNRGIIERVHARKAM